MVPSLLRKLRSTVPILGIIALCALFLKMPEVPNILGIFKCESCVGNTPYIPMLGAGYFAVLIALSMLFPNFPSFLIARGGIVWAVLLVLVLTYIDFPHLCFACLIGHLCNIAIWTIWLFVPPAAIKQHASPVQERLFLTLFAPIAMIALFSCLNLTLMVYHLKTKQPPLATSLKVGDPIPNFKVKDIKEHDFAHTDVVKTAGTFINFISPTCPFCREQLLILNDTIPKLKNHSYRFINVTPELSSNLLQQSPESEWVEDKTGALRELFHVNGYPTLFLIDNDGKILKIITGVSDELKKQNFHF